MDAPADSTALSLRCKRYEFIFRLTVLAVLITAVVGATVQSYRLEGQQEGLAQATAQLRILQQQRDNALIIGSRLALQAESPRVRQAFLSAGFPVEEVEQALAQRAAEAPSAPSTDSPPIPSSSEE